MPLVTWFHSVYFQDTFKSGVRSEVMGEWAPSSSTHHKTKNRMANVAEIGKLNRLKVIKRVNFGVYIDAGELGNILLPKGDLPKSCKPGDTLGVFILYDSKDRLIATTRKPKITVGQFGLLKVVSVPSFGAFLDWGLQRNLLVPSREQKEKMEEGKSYLVYCDLVESDRGKQIIGSSKLDKYLGVRPAVFKEEQPVDLVIRNETQLGYTAIVNHTHQGMLYRNEVFENLERGQQRRGFIKKVRNDGKLDLILQQPGQKKIGGTAQKIFSLLEKQGGFIALTDKSSPEIIYRELGISKKAFKMAIGMLYKRRLVTIEKDGIRWHGKK